MNWITTNIRLPEDVYMDLKMTAAKRRTSVSGLIRERLANKKRVAVIGHRKKIMARLSLLAKEMARQNPGVSLSKELIKMRYEQ